MTAIKAQPLRQRIIRRPSTRVAKVLLVCGIASSVLYVVSDLLGTLLYEGYSYADQEVSELLAAGAPTRPLMVALIGIPYGVLVAAFAVGVWTSAAPKRPARITGAMLVAFAAIGMVTGVFFEMDQREVVAAGEATLRHSVHAPGTAVMSLFLLLAMGFGATLLGRRFRYYTYGTIVTLIVFGVLAGLQAGQLEANQPTPWMGIEERINIYATMIWVAVLAIGLLRARRDIQKEVERS
jgi:hypothetical protein